MGTTLSRDCEAAVGLGHTPRDMFEHALGGVFADDETKARLHSIGEEFDWASATG
jgi:hypothetical protein